MTKCTLTSYYACWQSLTLCSPNKLSPISFHSPNKLSYQQVHHDLQSQYSETDIQSSGHRGSLAPGPYSNQGIWSVYRLIWTLKPLPNRHLRTFLPSQMLPVRTLPIELRVKQKIFLQRCYPSQSLLLVSLFLSQSSPRLLHLNNLLLSHSC